MKAITQKQNAQPAHKQQDLKRRSENATKNMQMV
jgi:hypothetical protein